MSVEKMSTKSGDTISSGSSQVNNTQVSSASPPSSSGGHAAVSCEAGIESPDKSRIQQDSFLENYWTELASFCFDRAKEIAEKEKETALKTYVGQSNIASPGFTWVIITTALSQITSTEKAYLNLVFLAPKGFLRKDCNLKSTLESIRHDLKKIANSAPAVNSSPSRLQNSRIASAVLIFVTLRLDLMEFYEKLSLLGTAKNVEISDLLCDVEVIYEKFNDDKNAAKDGIHVLDGIINSLTWECESLINLLRAHMMMQTWEYLQATIALQMANSKLLEWGEFIHTRESTKKSSFYKAGVTNPVLYLWILRLKGALVSKFTIYFYEVLAKSAGAGDVIKAGASLQIDYIYKLTMFKKKSDALFICIVFDAKDINFHPSGYQHLQRPIILPQGLDSYPAILAIPEKPVSHWPSVVMIISDRLQELNSDKFIGFYDKSAESTYFLLRIDIRMYMLIIYGTKKSEKDNYTQKFMNETATDLKCSKIFSALKSVK